MEDYYKTLLTIYDIVKADPSPHTYLCTPHEIILHEAQDWSYTEQHLKLLAIEKLIMIKQLDKIAICITQAGITKARSFNNNLLNKKVLFRDEDKFSNGQVRE